MKERCDHDHTNPTDPLFSVSAILREAADGGPLLHITVEHCPHLGDGELLAISSGLSRAMADLADAARANVARSN